MLGKLRQILKNSFAAALAAASVLMGTVPAFAAQLYEANVATGDTSVNIMPVIIGLLIVSAVLVVGFLVSSAAKNKKSGKGKNKPR